MAFSIISIMLFHQQIAFDNWGLLTVFQFIGFWGVDVFLVLSGYGIASSLERNTVKVFYLNRIRRLLPTCMIVGIGTLLFRYFMGTSVGIEYPVLHAFSFDSWYIYAITVYYAFSPLLIRFVKRFGVWILAVSILIGIVVCFFPIRESHYLISKTRWIASRLPSFLFGMYCYVKPIRVSDKQFWVFGLMAITINAALRYLQILYFETNWFIFSILFTVTPTLIRGVSWIYSMLHRLRILLSFIEFVGSITLELYLIHSTVFSFSSITHFPLINLFIAFSLSLFLAYLVHKLSTSISRLVNEKARCLD